MERVAGNYNERTYEDDENPERERDGQSGRLSANQTFFEWKVFQVLLI